MDEFEVVPFEVKEAAYAASNVADLLAAEAMSMARHMVVNETGLIPNAAAVKLAAAILHASTRVYAAHEMKAVLRELTPEIAGAISEAGTDIGSVILGCIQQAFSPTYENNNNT